MKGRMGIVSGRYRSVSPGPGTDEEPLTVVELFGRMDDGRSVCLLVHGLRPTFEIAPIGTWDPGQGIPSFLEDRLNHVKALDHVAYVRFASVYRSFQDLAEFRDAIESLEAEPSQGPEAEPSQEPEAEPSQEKSP